MAKKHITIDDHELRETLQQLKERGADFYFPLLRFRQYMAVETDSMFSMLSNARGGGGSHRGVRWGGFAPQYTRKDGTVIPAWGGVKKVRGTGVVKGRLRPSGTRVTAASAIMQDTGNLRGKATSVQFRRTNNLLTFGTSPTVRYAADQEAMRPYLFFFTPKDSDVLVEEFTRYLWKE